MTKQTFLHDKHVSLGARMVDFAGWHMPVQYSSIMEEYCTGMSQPAKSTILAPNSMCLSCKKVCFVILSPNPYSNISLNLNTIFVISSQYVKNVILCKY